MSCFCPVTTHFAPASDNDRQSSGNYLVSRPDYLKIKIINF